ncbi:hypothetical protein LSAJ156_440039 [Latilactobacillus sakei]|nr:hypothetical protein LSAJ160_260157 [Latilactobacillus sakei]SOB40518.1 hypothetical protein LSAJ18_210170 [Latilactobacillus sakei]SOB40615.1 hypothetical protein LSAJ156_440039 [Latilactobacillus sakei]SOB44576.1 hypothetical protein LSAJ112_330046 [Latilactobacillus sakei]SON66003.1 protein of unknown function [Latilactobacillus sakei]
MQKIESQLDFGYFSEKSNVLLP